MENRCKSAGSAAPPLLAAVAAGFCLVSAGALAQEDGIIRFEGSASTVTPEFEVEAPWIIDWRVFSDFPQSMYIEISLLDSKTGMHRGLIKETRKVDTGVKLFNESGAYKLRVDADLVRWQLLIKELTEEEAEAYTPKKREGGLGTDWFRNRDDRRN